MRKITVLVVALLLSFGVFYSAPAQAQTSMKLSDEEVKMIEHKREWKQKKKEKKIAYIKENLGINDKDAAQLYDLKHAYYENKNKMKEEMETLKKKKYEALEANKFDESNLNAIYEDIKNLKVKMIDAKRDYKVGLRKILSADQFKKYKEMKKSKKYAKSCECSGKSDHSKCKKCAEKKGSMKGSGHSH